MAINAIAVIIIKGIIKNIVIESPPGSLPPLFIVDALPNCNKICGKNNAPTNMQYETVSLIFFMLIMHITIDPIYYVISSIILPR